MSLVHDLIKIKYVREGYLPNWPYHLISDQEMCEAFLTKSEGQYSGYFIDNYPSINDNLLEVYQNLVDTIYSYMIRCHKASGEPYIFPDWVYSYMLGTTISINSSVEDIHDLLVLLNADNLNDIFDSTSAQACYDVSKLWVNKLNSYGKDYRPPTCFGEPHVIKSLRVSAAKQL